MRVLPPVAARACGLDSADLPHAEKQKAQTKANTIVVVVLDMESPDA
jgi:hypothetical protein